MLIFPIALTAALVLADDPTTPPMLQCDFLTPRKERIAIDLRLDRVTSNGVALLVDGAGTPWQITAPVSRWVIAFTSQSQPVRQIIGTFKNGTLSWQLTQAGGLLGTGGLCH